MISRYSWTAGDNKRDWVQARPGMVTRGQDGQNVLNFIGNNIVRRH